MPSTVAVNSPCAKLGANRVTRLELQGFLHQVAVGVEYQRVAARQNCFR